MSIPTTPPDNAGLARRLYAAIHVESAAISPRTTALIEAAREAAETLDAIRPSVWMDISTAPKDGSEVLAADQCGDQYILRWHDGDWMEQGCCRPEWTVTHWMPLPTPPKAPTP